MYSSRWTCAGCTARLRSLSTLPTTKAARFASTSGGPPVSSHDEASSHSSSLPSTNSPNRQPVVLTHKRLSRSRHPQTKAPSDNPALALFRQVVDKGEPHQPSPAAGKLLSELDVTAQLLELRKPGQDAMAVFQLFKANIWPHIEGLPGQLPKHNYMSATAVLGIVAREAKSESTLDLLRILQAMGIWSVHTRADLAFKACYEVLTHKDGDGDMEQKVMALINIWQHISQEKRLSQRGASLRFVFPKLEEAFADVDKSNANSQNPAPSLHMCLAALFPQLPATQVSVLVTALASSVSILSDEHFMSEATTQAASPLLDLVAAVMSAKLPRADSTLMNKHYKWGDKVPAERVAVVRAYVAGRWQRYQAEIRQAERNIEKGGPTALLTHLHKQLRVAYRTRNPSAAVKVWKTLQADLNSNTNLDPHLRKSGADFLEYLVFVLCALRLPDVLQETLDLMKRLEIHPTIKTYTGMMHGWKLCKDTDRIDALWQRLVSSGTRLDSFIWAERISGLIEFGKPQQAIDTLASMMSSWKATRSNQSPSAKPTIEVINAAVKGLLVSHEPDAAKGVLAWAAGEGIEPNVRTYNILLGESFKNDKTPDGVIKILADMRASNVDPDGATFTIILESVLSGIQDSSPSEQVAAVDQVFRDIASSGLAANGETYGKMLYAVASLSNGSDAAVEAVLNHMRARGLGITPHMVTMLVERTLSRNPTNPQALRDLLQAHGMTSVEKGDQALWERVVSTFALMGDLEGAMRWWDELVSRGRVVDSLACLKDLLTALVRRSHASVNGGGGEEEGQRYRDMAAKVVTTVLNHNKGKEVNERYWKHHFWYVAQENGLVGELPPPGRSK